MSDEHEVHNGGHELEDFNAPAMTKIILGLSVVVLISCIAVVQWFYSQRKALEQDTATPYYLQKYWGEMDAEKAGLGDVSKQIAADPNLLASDAPPAGWKHPDDVAAGK